MPVTLKTPLILLSFKTETQMLRTSDKKPFTVCLRLRLIVLASFGLRLTHAHTHTHTDNQFGPPFMSQITKVIKP